MKFTRKFAACLTVLLFVLATAAVFAQAEGTTDWGNGVIRVKGNGAGKAKYRNSSPGQYRLTAQQAARMDAQRKLAEYVSGVKVTAQSAMSDLALEDDRVTTALQSVVLRNAVDVGDAQFSADGICTITMELRMYGGGNSLAAAAFLPFKDETKTDFPQPVNAVTVDQSYTGLVVDCRGLNINPVMSPVIKNADGTSIYGHQNLNYDRIIVNGMASYSSDAYDQISQQRAGNNPLVVKAVRLDDFNANPVVSVADADRILVANAKNKFLSNCAVVFVK